MGMLGVLGIIGGVGLLAAYVIEIPPDVNTFRLLLFYAGSIGIAMAVAVRVRAAQMPTRFAVGGALPAILANAAALGWTLFAIGRERPFAGDFGLVGFYAGLAAWLADALLGLIALRLLIANPPGALLLAVGSLLAILGMGRLELTSQANPTIFGPISLFGIAMNGVAWVLIGLDVALPERGWRRRSADGTDPVPAT
jgi:hypothetical protein